MKNKVVVLGAGLVGKEIARDLSSSFDVTSVDNNPSALQEVARAGISGLREDLSDVAKIKKIVAPFDLVIGAVPGFMGYQTVRAVIEAGKNMVDISFFPEDPFALDDLARKQNVTVVTDCGVAPGMGNVILAYHAKKMKVRYYECLVGGLPVVREWPFEYKAVFSPADVIEEYTRPARYVQNGAMVVKEALSDPELIHFPGVGTLESWNSDGLRTLIRSFPGIPDMIEKTLRYPGTIEYLRVLRSCGFFSAEPVDINGTAIRPLDVTARLLFPKWKLQPGEKEFTVMRITIRGTVENQPKEYVYNLLDYTEQSAGTLSMARTTGYTCTAAAHLVIGNQFTRTGICPPEYLGENEEHFRFILGYLADRGVNYHVEHKP